MPTLPVSLGSRSTDFLNTLDPDLAFLVDHNIFPISKDPEFVEAKDASFMRPDDWVIGVEHDGEARCYPEWMLDNYHAVNDTIKGVHIAVFACEICCSNAVYLADHDGNRLTFGTGGLFGGTLVVFDEQTRSYWSHGMGTAFSGELKGVSLPLIQSYQASYKEWLELFSGTKVMVYPGHASHPDARHGHGTADTFAKAGMDYVAVKTMNVGNDPRLPENEMVLTLNLESEQAVVLLRSLNMHGVMQFDLGGEKLVVFGHGPSSSLAGVYHRSPDGTDLDFEYRDAVINDKQTGSTWRVDGLAVDGPLSGKRLLPLPTMMNKWHSLACFIPGVRIIAPSYEAPPVRERDHFITPFGEAGFQLNIDHRLYSLEIPHGCRVGFQVHINNDAFHILSFEDPSLASDHCLCRTHTIQADPCVIESIPPEFMDDLNSKPIHPSDRKWSALLDDASFGQAFTSAASSANEHPGPGLSEFLQGLSERGIDLQPRFSCHRDTLPATALFGIHCRIDASPFIIYRFPSEELAAENNPDPRHSIQVGHFVLRSDPSNYYINTQRLTDKNPDDRINWSKLLHDEEFIVECRDIFDRCAPSS